VNGNDEDLDQDEVLEQLGHKGPVTESRHDGPNHLMSTLSKETGQNAATPTQYGDEPDLLLQNEKTQSEKPDPFLREYSSRANQVQF
jgi:hypothetical protein